MSEVTTARLEYDELGFDTLPLAPGGKRAVVRSWQQRDPARLWQDAPDNANIAIRGGGLASVAFIDCDEKNQPGTFETVTRHLFGLGYQPGSYPVVQTASGIGRHIYVTFGGSLPGDSRNLAPEVGAGEFRYGSGAYVAAPPSIVNDGGIYRLISGDFARLPSLALSDVLLLIGNQDTAPTPKRKMIPRRAMALLNGKNTEGYKSNSEAEQSLIASLINAGYSFPEVLDLFNRNPCAGKYAELREKSVKNAARWLQKSYDKALEWTQAHESPTRRTIQAAIHWAESTPWTGRTGAIDRLVFLAHLSIAYKAGRLDWAASCRDLADLAGVGRETASKASYRIGENGLGLLYLKNQAVADCANIYHLNWDKVGHSLSTSTVRKCPTLSTNHDLFRQGGLGKTGGQIWQALQSEPATVEQLAEQTGRNEKTIRRLIKRMSTLADTTTGEYLPMIASDDGEIWHALPAELDRLALILGTAGKGKQQRRKHAEERRKHNRGLERGRK